MIKYTIKDKNTEIKCVNFDSILDQYEFLKYFVQSDNFGTVREVNKQDNFYGKRKFKDSLNGMMYGFQDDTQYFLDSIASVTKDTESDDGIGMDVEGYAYDMFSVINNIPECCLTMSSPSTKPYVKIMVDICFSCWYTAEEIRNRGIAITNLINTLLINGCIVDLCFMELNIQSDLNVMYTVKVDTELLPISNIAFICSPEYFRKIGFCTIDAIRERKSEDGRGRSKVFDFMLKKFKKDKLFFIGGSFTNPDLTREKLETVNSANKYILEIFKKYCEENKIVLNIDSINK